MTAWSGDARHLLEPADRSGERASDRAPAHVVHHIVREAGDLSAGVFDRRGFMVAQAVTGLQGPSTPVPGHETLPGRHPIETLRLATFSSQGPWKPRAT